MRKNEGKPHALKKCSAKTRAGLACKNWGMPNGRCRMHGGKSTGPRTREGIERIRQANWRHGRYSAKAREERRLVRLLIRTSREVLDKAREEILE